ncbi:SURP and G-patch domain-containing protein 1-like [Oppia nitens]|uniref:SURP and G-patch domain-containing protein 1-like n=1 Tax=Oppia nitens TaxID=1686743 RepID=UPI0023DCB2B2|nr:SURP and G-patch domain-containing protein 1-like [Oppia nitens]
MSTNKWFGSRTTRREQMSQQEALILQRKLEIESKLKSKETPSTTSSTTSSTCEEPTPTDQPDVIPTTTEFLPNPESPTITIIDEPTSSSSSSSNKFQNDGSFLAKFLEMSKQNQPNSQIKIETESTTHEETTDTKKTIKPIKMVIKDNTSKLKAVNSTDESNVKLEDDIKVFSPEDKEIELAIERTAITVAMNGDNAEETMRQSTLEDINYSWLRDTESEYYKFYQKRTQELTEAKMWAQNESSGESSESKPKRQRKSRWSDEKVVLPTDPTLIQYALQVFGTTDLTEDQWKQLEDQRKMKFLFEMLQNKQKQNEMLAQKGKVKYEYDSDEDVEDGTWEHKRRRQEMVKTQILAQQLTEKAAGKHHIGDFMPPEELDKFMKKWDAVKNGAPLPSDSDYSDSKLQEDNVGFQMLKKLGWTEGQGLGASGTGTQEPINKGAVAVNNAGLGQNRPEELNTTDDEYEAYRKRMMMAYRFRPNPLNNPRRAYY